MWVRSQDLLRSSQAFPGVCRLIPWRGSWGLCLGSLGSLAPTPSPLQPGEVGLWFSPRSRLGGAETSHLGLGPMPGAQEGLRLSVGSLCAPQEMVRWGSGVQVLWGCSCA